jgi:hypothetical protein
MLTFSRDQSEPRSRLKSPATEEVSDEDNSGEEEDVVEAGVGAYQLLLQSLQRDGPQETGVNKRRRVETIETVESSTAVNKDNENQTGAATHGEGLDSFAPDESDSDASEADAHSEDGDADSGMSSHRICVSDL